ncbi:methyltransferase domain-containing protein [Natronorubrum sp. JWXQ-INN-674]|uniref:Methyltransferase domain-containing protein n=1 Tax=Natronorubrum halalkaliphilum TaxID=2691917 RepID=A0A6B0VJC5_9EURY|nr:class I SAM-dependent methyltransferase [Natronorubrum halalkaliphilum]MXV61644.1 methyltransferase domain-containing protein [Natronorubrum halalkaliphilum]
MDSTAVRRRWEERSGEYSPEYYAYYGPNEMSETIRSILERFVARDASILELGCSSGRHLAHLHEHGFEELAGIDVNNDAFEVMADTYPDLAAAGTFYHDSIENVVGQFETGQFDVVYSVETLQHLHPDVEWVLEDLARITDELLITAENEGESEGEPEGESQDNQTQPDVTYVNDDFPLYHRNWNRVFTELGFLEVDVRSGKRDTVRTFRPTA